MDRLIKSFGLAVVFCLAQAWSANAAINVLRFYHLGEADPGAVAGGIVTNSVDSISGNNLSMTGSPVYSTNTPGVSLSTLSVQFSGDDYGTANLVTNLTDNFGVEAWVKTEADSDSHFIVYNGNTGATGWGILQSDTNYIALFGGITIFGSAPASANTWTHVALVRNNGTTTFYVNGVAAGSTTQAPNTPDTGFAIATKPEDPGDAAWVGLIDEVRVFTFAPGAFRENDLLLIAPTLNVSQQGQGILLTWPTNTSRFYGLEASTNLLSTNWTKLTPYIANGLFIVSNSASAGSQFFELNNTIGPPCGANLPPYLPAGLGLLANGSAVTNDNFFTISFATANTFDASAFIDPSACVGDTLSWNWTVTLDGTNITTGISGTNSPVLTLAPGLDTNGTYQIDLSVTGATGLSTNVTLYPNFGFGCYTTNTPIQLQLTAWDNEGDPTNSYTSYYDPDAYQDLFTANGPGQLMAFDNSEPTNFIQVSVIGDATNCPSAYTYQWYIYIFSAGASLVSDQGISGYATPQLAIQQYSVPDQQEMDCYLVVTRLADGRQDTFTFYTKILESAVPIDLFSTCQNSTNACPTCPCTNPFLLPLTPSPYPSPDF